MSLDELPLPYELDRTRKGPVTLTALGDRLHLTGRSNYGKPAQQFADKIAALDDEALIRETGEYIWLSAYASNNPTSDYHWMATACYYEAQRRGNPDLYQQAYDQARGE
jgi:hypothetical protein